MTTASLDDVVKRLCTGPLAPRTRVDEPIGVLTTYRVGGAASALVTLEEPADVDHLVAVLRAVNVPVVAIGRGSNLLVADEGFRGVAVVLGGGFSRVEVEGTLVQAGGAAKLPVVARTSVQAGLTGFEWAVGVPGSIGGAVRMNAGGHGAEIVDSLEAAEIVDLTDGSRGWRDAATLDLSYRHSNLGPTEIVLAARFGLAMGDPERGRAEMAEIVQWRRTNQPGGQNAGSVFTNPEGDSAGRLIDTAGGKGLRIGSAAVSTKHANFIQADEGGRSGDVLAVMREVQRLVAEVHGVELRPETHLVGFTDPNDRLPEGEAS